jgi:hypothetical protein
MTWRAIREALGRGVRGRQPVHRVRRRHRLRRRHQVTSPLHYRGRAPTQVAAGTRDSHEERAWKYVQLPRW